MLVSELAMSQKPIEKKTQAPAKLGLSLIAEACAFYVTLYALAMK